MLVRNSAQRLSDLLTGVKCRATSVAKNIPLIFMKTCLAFYTWFVIPVFFYTWSETMKSGRVCESLKICFIASNPLFASLLINGTA